MASSIDTDEFAHCTRVDVRVIVAPAAPKRSPSQVTMRR